MSRRPIYFLPLLMLCLCLCSSFLLSLAFSPKALAFATPITPNPITISSQNDSIHFPSYIDFTMTASDSIASINQAVLFITFKDTPDAVTQQHSITVNPGRSVTLHWREDTGSTNFHSPGTPVEYYWELQDSSNNQYAEAPQDFMTMDTRFSWQHLSQGLLQVNWYARPSVFGQQVLKEANSSIQQISQRLGGSLLHPINLWIYTSNEDFHGALSPNSYEWVGGEAHPYLNEAFITVEDSEDITLTRDMPHELTHLVFHQLIAQGIQAPTWFDEGLAVNNQYYHEPEMSFRFTQALMSHTLLRLDQVSDGFPADADKAYLAYAQSWNLVSYMYSTFGSAKIGLLIKKMNNPQTSFVDDLTQALREDELHLENQWRLHLNQPSVPGSDTLTPTPASSIQLRQPQSTPTDTTAPLFTTLGALLILLPMLGIVAIFLYSRRRRQSALAIEAAQHILASRVPPGQPDYPIHYTNTAWNTPPVRYPGIPPRQYPPVSYGGPGQALGGPPAPTHVPFFLPQTPVPPPDTPGIAWQTEYPALPGKELENRGPFPFGPFQENIHQQSGEKAPQE